MPRTYPRCAVLCVDAFGRSLTRLDVGMSQRCETLSLPTASTGYIPSRRSCRGPTMMLASSRDAGRLSPQAFLAKWATAAGGDAARALCGSVVDEMVLISRASGPGVVLDLIDRLSLTDAWPMMRSVVGPRLCRILSRAALSHGDALDYARTRLRQWLNDQVLDRHHIQNALKGVDSATDPKDKSHKQQRQQQPQFSFEEARGAQKRRRIDRALRPRNESPDAEFNEIWARWLAWDGSTPAPDIGLGVNVYRVDDNVDLSQPTPRDRHVVFIWDLDETLVLFNALLDPKRYKQRFSWAGGHVARVLGERLERILFDVADRHFFFKQVEKYDQSHVETLRDFDDFDLLDNYDFDNDGLVNRSTGEVSKRKLAYRFRTMQVTYRKPLSSYVSMEVMEELSRTMRELDLLSGGWLSAAKRAAERIWASSGATNVLVSAGQLTPTLVKLVLYGLSTYFSVENVYSSRNTSKEDMFRVVLGRFGANCAYDVIGDDRDEDAACSVFRDANAESTFSLVERVDHMRRLSDRISDLGQGKEFYEHNLSLRFDVT
ncbi:hypothetical protein PBRA_004207 [Plasmodiophora brassicae]|uniref:protein-tyrosine-phosphatase n=1 Tax=Plasmodiophora brassicae TaxID=37360 RepID=A0A0G4IJR7_PLABS|nr:hypothetical protein PBRA_004207 [Plasmodiophora brassicae]